LDGRQHDQLQASATIHQAAAKAKEKLRLNSLKLLHFDSRDEQLIQDSYQQVLYFTDGLQLSPTLTPQDIMSALQAAHTAANEYYTMRHALAWNTDFVFPAEAIEADSTLFRECNYDFPKMCQYKQSKLAHNRLFYIWNYWNEDKGCCITGFQHITRICHVWDNTHRLTIFQSRSCQRGTTTRSVSQITTYHQ
jgi:hypothetical protein